jgi:hypothetical protein
MTALDEQDDEFATLREDFPGWYFWRARDGFGMPNRSWMASRTDEAAGVEPTLMARDEPALRVLLSAQKATVENGGIPPKVAARPDAFWNPAYL